MSTIINKARFSIQLTDREVQDPAMRSARMVTHYKEGLFGTVSEAQQWGEALAAAIRGDPVDPAWLANLDEDGKFLRELAAREAAGRRAWDRQQKHDSLKQAFAKAVKDRAIEASKLQFIAGQSAETKAIYQQHIGRGDVQPGLFAALGANLIGLDAMADFIRDEVLPACDAEITAAQTRLAEFTASQGSQAIDHSTQSS